MSRCRIRLSLTPGVFALSAGLILLPCKLQSSLAGEVSTNAASLIPSEQFSGKTEQAWNWHPQNTDIIQGDPDFHAPYSGPNSLNQRGEVRETISLDLLAGLRLLRGAEAHMDGLVWQGYGLSKTLGAEAFPNGEAFRSGNQTPNANITRLFIRQNFGLGGETKAIQEDSLH